MKSKVLLTGGTGLLGSNIAELLIMKGFDVRTTVRKTSDLRALKDLRTELHVADLLDISSLRAAIKGCDYVIHAAADTSQAGNEEELQAVNCDGTSNIIDVSQEAGIKKFIHISSANTFLRSKGSNAVIVFNHYMNSKLEAENRVMRAFCEGGLPVVIISPSFMIGSRDAKPGSGEIITRFLNNKIVISPNGGKNFVPVKDVAACAVAAMEKGKTGSNYLISGENLTYTEFYRTMITVSGMKRTIIKLPVALTSIAGCLGTLIEKITGTKRRMNHENAALLNTRLFYPETMAFEQLEINRTSIVEAIREAIVWFGSNGTRKNMYPKSSAQNGKFSLSSRSRLKLKTRIALFSFLISLLCTPAFIQAQNLRYTVYAAGSDVGGLKAICTRVSGNSFTISLETKLNLPFKKIVSLIQARYDGNKLVFASSEKRINSRLDEWITISLQNGKYKIENEKGNKSTFTGPIAFSVGMLYHFEPMGQTLVFSERLGTFVPIKKTSTGVYELCQPDGKKNIFKYSNGVCTEMKTEILASSVRFRLDE